MTGEIWKKVILEKKEYSYFISSFGRVKNKRGHILKPYKRGQRMGTYHCVALYKYGYRKQIDIQRLVALHFIPNPDNKPEVNHYDLNHFNNRADNLEWSTRSENMMHSWFMRGCLKVENMVAKAGIVV